MVANLWDLMDHSDPRTTGWWALVERMLVITETLDLVLVLIETVLF